MASPLPLVSCSLRYLAVYLVLAVGFGFLQVWLDISLGVLATVATLVGASGYVAFWTVRQRATALSGGEAFKLSLCSVLTSLFLVALIVALLLLRADLRGYLALFDRTGLLYAGLLVLAYFGMALLLQWGLYYLFARCHYRILKNSGGAGTSASVEGEE